MIDGQDLVTPEVIRETRASTRIIYNRVMATVLASSLVFGVSVGVLIHFLKGTPVVSSIWIGLLASCITGVLLAIHWIRHYRAIFRQLNALESRVAAGDQLRASGVAFRSYR